MVFLTSLISKPLEARVAQRLSTVFLLSRPRHSLNSLAAVVKEIEEIPAHLPNGAALKDSVQRARDWLQEVEALQVGFQRLTCVSASVKSRDGTLAEGHVLGFVARALCLGWPHD